MTLISLSSVYVLVNCKELWIGLCIGIPILVALLMGDDWNDASIRRSSDKSDEKENDDSGE